MAENIQQPENEIINTITSMANRPLVSKFMKYFTNTPANEIRSIDFGKTVFRYFRPDVEIPQDPAALLLATRQFLTSNEYANDENMVGCILNIVKNKEYALLTPDIVADVVESDAYKEFGQNKGTDDYRDKQSFERWIREKSMLSKIDQAQPGDIVLYQDSLSRVVDAIVPDKKKQAYLQQIDSRVRLFDEIYVKDLDQDALYKLQEIAKDSKTDYAQRLKNIYSVLCDDLTAGLIHDLIDDTRNAADPKDRNTALTGFGIATNKILLAVAQRKGWSNLDIQNINLKFPIEERAEHFEQEAARRQAPLTGTTGAVSNASQDEEFEFATVDDFQPTQENNEQAAQQNGQPTQAKNELMVAPSKELMVAPSKELAVAQPPKFNYALDVAKTFGFTFGGALAISAISAIPGVGPVAGPLFAVYKVAEAGITQACAAVKAAKANGNLTKAETVSIAAKTAGAVLLKMGPYAASMAFGPISRAVGSAVVFGKTLFEDLERRANLQNAEIEKAKPKGLKGVLKHLSDIAHNVSLADGMKSFAYAAAKGGAMYLGGKWGSSLGNKLGTFSSSKFVNGKIDETAINEVAVENHEIEEMQPADEYKNDDLYARREGPYQQGEFNDDVVRNWNDGNPVYGPEDQPQFNEAVMHINGGMAQDTGVQLSDANLQRMSQIGQVELTDNARATAYVENHRQFIGGVQEDWCNAAQEKIAIQTLRDAGVDDPYGVWRKLGSASRFFGGEYKEAWDDLCNGKFADKNVNTIFNSLRLINEEGGLGRVAEQTYQAPQPVHVQPVPEYPVYEPVPDDIVTEVPQRTQDYHTPRTEIIRDSMVDTQPVYQPEQPVYEPVTDEIVTDVPVHTQDYHTPVTDIVKESMVETQPVEPVVQETVTPVPSHTQDYQAGDNEIVNEQSSIPMPSHTADFVATGNNDIFGGEEFAATVNEPATLSNDQLARLHANYLRGIEFDETEASEYLSQFNQSELHEMRKFLNDSEINTVDGILAHQQSHSIEDSQPKMTRLNMSGMDQANLQTRADTLRAMIADESYSDEDIRKYVSRFDQNTMDSIYKYMDSGALDRTTMS